MNAQDSTSTRPYLIRALYEWCTDNGFTPYVAVRVDGSVQVPREYVKDGEIVLNISCDATSSLQLGNDFIEFKARFGGKPREIMVPVARVIAIYARENGQGMAFPPPEDIVTAMGDMGEGGLAAVASTTEEPPGAPEERVVQLVSSDSMLDEGGGDAPRPPPASGSARPSLKRIK
jgi:stringent starvation protein B